VEELACGIVTAGGSLFERDTAQTGIIFEPELEAERGNFAAPPPCLYLDLGDGTARSLGVDPIGDLDIWHRRQEWARSAFEHEHRNGGGGWALSDGQFQMYQSQLERLDHRMLKSGYLQKLTTYDGGWGLLNALKNMRGAQRRWCALSDANTLDYYAVSLFRLHCTYLLF
jgi:hypothetical protein